MFCANHEAETLLSTLRVVGRLLHCKTAYANNEKIDQNLIIFIQIIRIVFYIIVLVWKCTFNGAVNNNDFYLKNASLCHNLNVYCKSDHSDASELWLSTNLIWSKLTFFFNIWQTIVFINCRSKIALFSLFNRLFPTISKI